MVPRDHQPAPELGLYAKIKRVLSLKVPAVEAQSSDDVVAIKCNLCEQTPLNPPGARRQAYSCEENCPTGALVRVNPSDYFDEIGATKGFVFRDQTHAVGRNIHKNDPLARAWHVVGLIFVGLASISTMWGLSKYGLNGRLGGSWLTMRWLTGLIGLFGVAAVMTYPLRKQIYRRRAGALRYWMLAHVYLGVVTGIILLLHSGTNAGGLITTLLYLSFDVVVFSGILGVISYLVAPRILTNIESEPLLIEDLITRRGELKQELADTVAKSEGWLREEIEERVSGRFLSRRFLLRQLLRRESLKDLLADARQEFKERTVRLTTADERELLLTAVEKAVTLRRVEALIFLHQMLKQWIPLHAVSTALMLALMIVHIIQAIFFGLK